MHNKEIAIEKIGGKSNLADGLTKFVDGKDLAIHVEGIKLENRTGRDKEAPNMAEGNSVPTVEWSDGYNEGNEPNWVQGNYNK